LQQIPLTQYFSLITLLELPGSPQVTDDFISHFIHLHSLVALDISGTKVSYLAVKRLSQSLILETSPSSPRAWHGPWPLRILRLHGCRNIDNLVFQYTSKFPLLCVLDIRGTQCIPRIGSLPPEWERSNEDRPFFNSSLSNALDSLSSSESIPCKMWSSQPSFKLLINAVNEPTPHDEANDSLVQPEDQSSGVSLSSFYGKPKVSNGSSDAQKHDLLPNGVSAVPLSKLMLCRNPPPWTALNEAVLNHARDRGNKVVRKNEEVVAVKGGTRQQAALARLQEMSVRRTDTSVDSSSKTSQVNVIESRSQRKNPFSKRRRE